MKQTLNKMSKNDKSFYRIGTADEMNPNDPLLYGYNGLSNYV
ncbi:ABC transporter permease, partial [Lactobacillus sp. UMNPBX16]